MICPLLQAARWSGALVLLATIPLAVLLVRWADGDYLRLDPPSTAQRGHTVSRPDWVWAWRHPYQRLQHDWFWFCAAATLGVGGLLVTDGRTWTRRRRAQSGTAIVLVILLVGGVSVAEQLLVRPTFGRSNGLSYSLRNTLEFRLPGAILGVWVVAWLRPRRGQPEMRERTARLIGWMWMASVFLLIGYGLLFG